MATKSKTEVTAFKHDIGGLLDITEKKFRLTSLTTDTEARRTSAVSTGILSLDLMMGGGILPGLWITVYGGEGSAKSTTLATMLGSLATHGVKGAYYDYEGCVTAHSTVETPEGKVKVQQLVDHLSTVKPDEWYDPLPNTQLLTAGGYGNVVRIGYKGLRPVHRMATESGRVVEGFAHPVLVKDASTGCLVYRKQEEIKVGDKVVVKAT